MSHYFLAIPLPQRLQSLYESWQEELRMTFSYKKWTAKEDFHIKLKFLGRVEDGKLKVVIHHMESLSDISRFSIILGSLGKFGRNDQPRVLYVDVKPNEDLNVLQNFVIKQLTDLDFPVDQRPYRPHVTLAK